MWYWIVGCWPQSMLLEVVEVGLETAWLDQNKMAEAREFSFLTDW
jgi:hypothetical protein